MGSEERTGRRVITEFTPENITSLKDNEVFVFGSNLSGIHGKGAAKLAQEKFGAKRGFAFGLCGQSYAIPTRGVWLAGRKTFAPMQLDEVGEHVWNFRKFAEENPQLKFYVTKIGCGYAGFQPYQIANLLSLFMPFPENVVLPREFYR